MPDDFRIQSDFPLDHCNTFGLPAKASRYLLVKSLEDLRRLRSTPDLASLPRLILGGGSNIVLTGDFPGIVLQMAIGGMTVVGEDDNAVFVRAGAGESWHSFVLWTLAQGLGGLENLSLIPGSVGAAPIQNIGAYGAEVKDLLREVSIFDWETGDVQVLRNEDCEFAYRDSIFKHRLRDRTTILDVSFALPKRWQANLTYTELAKEIAAKDISHPTPKAISDAVVAIRTRKLPDPAVIGNAGSFFKNPVVSSTQRDELARQYPGLVSYPQDGGNYKLAAGWLIEQCGWKGKRQGAAGVYERQALVLVNHGGATGKQILALARAIQEDVKSRFGVGLEIEPVLV